MFCSAAVETETRGIEMILTSDHLRLLGGGDRHRIEERTMTSLHCLKTCMENIIWLWQAEKDALAFGLPLMKVFLFEYIFECNFVSNLNDFACFS